MDSFVELMPVGIGSFSELVPVGTGLDNLLMPLACKIAAEEERFHDISVDSKSSL